MLITVNNYSMNRGWIQGHWKMPKRREAQSCLYNQLRVTNKGEWKDCFSKYSASAYAQFLFNLTKLNVLCNCTGFRLSNGPLFIVHFACIHSTAGIKDNY